MTALKDAFPIPILHVNKYVWNEMKTIDPTLATTYDGIVPFFPLADSRGGDATWENKPYVVYDHLFKLNKGKFPHIHRIHLLYFVRGTAEDVVTWTNAIHHILDRGDEAAQDCNVFLAETNQDADVYFHCFESFGIDMVNDQRQDLAVRQYYTASMVIQADYHITRGTFA